MKALCILGLHSWDGCTCMTCGRHRASGHAWIDGGRPASLTRTKSELLTRVAACGELCGRCYTRRFVPESDHLWNECGVCLRCGKRREVGDEHHHWGDCACTRCGQPRLSQVDIHAWGEWQRGRSEWRTDGSSGYGPDARCCVRCGCRQTRQMKSGVYEYRMFVR